MALAVYQLSFLFVFSLTTTLVIAASENKGWEKVHNANISSIIPLKHYNGKSYYMGTLFKANYYKAIAFCKHMNMELLTIRSADENNKILDLIKEAKVGNGYWTSGTRVVDGSSWIWLPYAEKIDYHNWSKGKPKRNRYERFQDECLEVWMDDDELKWIDRYCTTRNWFICERYHDSNGGSPHISNS